MLSRFGISSKTQRILLSVIAVVLAVVIGVLQEDAPPEAGARAEANQTQSSATRDNATQDASVQNRQDAVAAAVRWLESQEGGKHRGHAIARHVAKSDADLRDRMRNDPDVRVASTFYDMETAAVAILRTIRHQPNDARVSQWLGDDGSRRRLALRRTFEKPIGRIAYADGGARDGKSAVAVLLKWRDSGNVGYRLLTAYVEP